MSKMFSLTPINVGQTVPHASHPYDLRKEGIQTQRCIAGYNRRAIKLRRTNNLASEPLHQFDLQHVRTFVPTFVHGESSVIAAQGWCSRRGRSEELLACQIWPCSSEGKKTHKLTLGAKLNSWPITAFFISDILWVLCPVIGLELEFPPMIPFSPFDFDPLIYLLVVRSYGKTEQFQLGEIFDFNCS